MNGFRLYLIFTIFGLTIIALVYLLTSRQFQPVHISYNCQPGKTAFDLLEQNSSQPVQFQQSSFGKMVISINGITQANGKYWIYSTSGHEATTSADNYVCQGDEMVAWELK